MWSDKRILDLFGIEHPIIQAPMAGSATPELAAAVGAAGGLGSLGCSYGDEMLVREYATQIRNLTNAAFNLNFFVYDAAPALADDAYEALKSRMSSSFPDFQKTGFPENPGAVSASFTEETLALLLELRPPVVSFHFGTPSPSAIQALKDNGTRLLASATTVAEAVALETVGIDAIIAQGWEAGGHRGSFQPGGPGDGVGLMSLVPQIVDAVDVPVIAAGGIADGRGIAAALALGASGVQIGTAFLRCPEASTTSAHRHAIASTSAENTMFTNAVSGRFARGMASAYARIMADIPGPYPTFPAMYDLSRPIVDAARETEPDKASFHLFGQSAALARVEPARDVVARLVNETRSVLSKPG